MKTVMIGKPAGYCPLQEAHKLLSGSVPCGYDSGPDELRDLISEQDPAVIEIYGPFQQAVLQYLDETDPGAERTGTVTTVLNRRGKLKGYNTAVPAFKNMVREHGIEMSGKHAAVFGTGGLSKSVQAALKDMQCTFDVLDDEGLPKTVTPEGIYRPVSGYSFLINTDDTGPEADPGLFGRLEAVIDLITDPLCTKLCFNAGIRGITALGGFELPVRQAFLSRELYTGEKADPKEVRECIYTLLSKRRNIVIIGMPTAGKTTVSKLLSEATGREVVEMDEEAEKVLGTSIRECFETKGEAYFRKVETDVARKFGTPCGRIISCGGGVIKTPETMRLLSENGLVFWLQRDLDQLFPTDSRPLSSTSDAVRSLYEERLPLYRKYADIMIDNTGSFGDTIAAILEKI